MIVTMHFADEVKDFPKTYSRPEITKQELSMACQLVEGEDTPFDPAAYHDEYNAKKRKLVEDKIAGREIVAATQRPQGNVLDLMDAVQRMLEAQGKKSKTPSGSRKKQGA